MSVLVWMFAKFRFRFGYLLYVWMFAKCLNRFGCQIKWRRSLYGVGHMPISKMAFKFLTPKWLTYKMADIKMS